MPRFLDRWLRKPPQAETVANEGGEPRCAVGAAESLEDLYQEMRETFYIRPDVRFIDFLEAEGVTRLIEWLQPTTPCALPKGFIRLAVDATRKGNKIWEAPYIAMRYEGNWDRGGLPEQESLDAVSVLAQVLRVPIKLYYTETPDGEIMVMKFAP